MALNQQDDFQTQQRKLLTQRMQPQVEPTQQAAPSVPPPPPAAPEKVMGNNGWYSQGTQTYDQNNLLQGDTGYNRAGIADALYKIQTSADRGNTFNLDQWLAANQNIATGVTSGKGGEMINLPGGGSYDIRRGYNAATNTGDVVSFGAAGDPGDGGYTAAGAGGGGDSGGGGSSSYSQSGSAGNSDFQNQIRAMLMQQMGAMGKPVDENDPAISGELQSQDRLAERTRQDRRAASAERMAAQGLNTGGQGSGAFDQETAAGYQDKNNGLSDVRSQLFSRELTARRDKLTQMMSMAMQSGDAEAARSIQMALAQMNDQLQRAQLGQQKSQFDDNFGLNAAQFQYGKDRDLAGYGSGG
jgi:hypothetical protein